MVDIRHELNELFGFGGPKEEPAGLTKFARKRFLECRNSSGMKMKTMDAVMLTCEHVRKRVLMQNMNKACANTKDKAKCLSKVKELIRRSDLDIKIYANNIKKRVKK